MLIQIGFITKDLIFEYMVSVRFTRSGQHGALETTQEELADGENLVAAGGLGSNPNKVGA